MGDLDTARQLYEISVDGQRDQPSGYCPKSCRNVLHLASLYQRAKRYDEAENLVLRVKSLASNFRIWSKGDQRIIFHGRLMNFYGTGEYRAMARDIEERAELQLYKIRTARDPEGAAARAAYKALVEALYSCGATPWPTRLAQGYLEMKENQVWPAFDLVM
jgi:hypothetical protein